MARSEFCVGTIEEGKIAQLLQLLQLLSYGYDDRQGFHSRTTAFRLLQCPDLLWIQSCNKGRSSELLASGAVL